jgi:hypothetical protein
VCDTFYAPARRADARFTADPAGSGPLRRWWRRLPLLIGAWKQVVCNCSAFGLTHPPGAVHRGRPVLFSERALCVFAPSSFEKEAWHFALRRTCAPASPAPPLPAAGDDAAADAAPYAAFLRAAEAAARAGITDAAVAASAAATASADAPGWLACLNHVAARYFFDLQRNPRVADALAARLQLQLSRLDTPPFISALRVVRVTLPPGGAPPRAARLALCDAEAHPACGAAAQRGPIPAYEVRKRLRVRTCCRMHRASLTHARSLPCCGARWTSRTRAA